MAKLPQLCYGVKKKLRFGCKRKKIGKIWRELNFVCGSWWLVCFGVGDFWVETYSTSKVGRNIWMACPEEKCGLGWHSISISFSLPGRELYAAHRPPNCSQKQFHQTIHWKTASKTTRREQEKPISFHAIFSSPNKNLSTMQCKGNPQIPTRTELFSTLHLIIFLDGIW